MMIAKLTGLVDATGDGWAVIDVAGVGYLVFGSARTLARLPRSGGSAALLVETHVREDHIHLYGFADAAERQWFRLLTGVQGVGGRVALAILSVAGPEDLARAIAAQDRAMLTRADGVGPKLAGRILAELKDKAGQIMLGEAARGLAAGSEPQAAGAGPAGDAVSALVNLGYSRSEAFGAVTDAARRLGAAATVETLIREGLQELGR